MTFASEVSGINYNFDGNSGDSYIPYKAAVTSRSSGTYRGDIVQKAVIKTVPKKKKCKKAKWL